MYQQYLSRLFLVVLSLLWLPIAEATVVEIKFSGDISGFDGLGVFGAIGASLNGLTASGVVRYDTLLAPVDTSNDAHVGSYSDGTVDWFNAEITINGISEDIFDQYANVGQSILTNNSSDPTVIPETLIFQENSNNGGNGIDSDALLSNFRLQLFSTSGDFIDSDLIPISLGAFTGFSINGGVTKVVPNGSIAGTAEHTNFSFSSLDQISVEQVSVSEPTSLFIMALGLLGFGARFKAREKVL